jgi:hypothetical protein
MRTPLLAALVGGMAFVLAACGSRQAEDPGPNSAKDFQVGDFKSIESAGSYDVTVRTGARPSVRAEGPQKMLDRLLVEVKGDTLTIRSQNGNFHWGRTEPVRIAVTVPELHGATIAGSGTLTVDKVVADRFKATIAGSGDLSLPQVQTKTLELEIAGSGSGSLAGRADAANYSIAGSGEVDASKLQSKDVELSIAGSGAVSANATGTVQGAIMGSGEARITGGAKCQVTKAGSGSIVCS